MNENLRALPYADRLKMLLARGIGLWDVIDSGERNGSLDSAIRNAKMRDLPQFIERLPQLRVVAFNGKTAAANGRRQLSNCSQLSLIDLPSSSGAYAAMSRQDKIEAWKTLIEYLP